MEDVHAFIERLLDNELNVPETQPVPQQAEVLEFSQYAQREDHVSETPHSDLESPSSIAKAEPKEQQHRSSPLFLHLREQHRNVQRSINSHMPLWNKEKKTGAAR